MTSDLVLETDPFADWPQQHWMCKACGEDGYFCWCPTLTPAEVELAFKDMPCVCGRTDAKIQINNTEGEA